MGWEGARGGWPVAAALVALAVAGPLLRGLHALETDLSDQQIERALRLGRSTAAERERFHRRSVFPADGRMPVVNGLQLESIEVISEFRRMELIAEEHARINDTFGRAGLTDVRKALAPWRGRVVVVAHVRLAGPAANLVTFPRVDVALDALPAAGGAVRRDISNDAALIGGSIETPFDAAIVGQTRRTAAVRWNDKLLGAARIDFRAID
jgi:hypothetical protein